MDGSAVVLQKSLSTEYGADRRSAEYSVDKDRTTSYTPRPRRYHTQSYKKEVLNKIAEIRRSGNGTIGAYLRSEGLYYTAVTRWEEQLKSGGLMQEKPKKSSSSDLRNENRRLKRQLEKAQKQLEQKDLLISFQKKMAQILEDVEKGSISE